jgi:hypothetical protein
MSGLSTRRQKMMNRSMLSLLSVLAAVSLAACDRSRQPTAGETPPEAVGTGELRGATTEAGAAAPAGPKAIMEEPSPAEPSKKAKAGTPEQDRKDVGDVGGGSAEKAKTAAGATVLPPFEGELEMKLQGKAPESFHYAMKGDKIRLGITSAPGSKDKGVDAIIDTSDGKAVVLMNDKKQFAEVDLTKLAKRAAERAQQVEVEKTGVTETVSGRECEQWKIKDKDYAVTACVVKRGPYFNLAALEEQAAFTAPAWVHEVVDAGYIPLKISVSDAAGKSLAATQLKETKGEVERSKFEVPTGYTKVNPPAIPGVKR